MSISLMSAEAIASSDLFAELSGVTLDVKNKCNYEAGMTLLPNLSAAQLRRAVGIKEQIEKLEADLNRLLGASGATSFRRSSGRRNLSPEARERIAAAQRKRWAQYRKAAK